MSLTRFSIGLFLLVQVCVVSAQESRPVNEELEQLRLENKTLKREHETLRTMQSSLQQEKAGLQVKLREAELISKDDEARVKQLQEETDIRLKRADQTIQQTKQQLEAALLEQQILQQEVKRLQSLVDEAEKPILDALSAENEPVRKWMHKNLLKLPWPQRTKMIILTKDLEPKPLSRSERLKRAFAAPGETYEFLETPLSDAVAFWGDLYDIEIVVSRKIDSEKCLITCEVKGEKLRTAMEDALRKSDLYVRVVDDVVVIDRLNFDELLK